MSKNSLDDKLKHNFLDSDLPPLDPNQKIIDSVDGLPISRYPPNVVSSVDGIPINRYVGKTVGEILDEQNNRKVGFLKKIFNYFSR